VPYPAGGPTDQAARQIASKMGGKLGQNFVVENVSGGGTNIAGQRVARAAPDGYTLFVHNLQIAANVSLPRQPNVEYVDVSTAAELAAAAKARFTAADVLLMAAAVADYRPAEPTERKIKKTEAGAELALRLERTEDVLSALVHLGYSRAEAERAVERATREGGPGRFEDLLRQVLRTLSR